MPTRKSKAGWLLAAIFLLSVAVPIACRFFGLYSGEFIARGDVIFYSACALLVLIGWDQITPWFRGGLAGLGVQALGITISSYLLGPLVVRMAPQFLDKFSEITFFLLSPLGWVYMQFLHHRILHFFGGHDAPGFMGVESSLLTLVAYLYAFLVGIVVAKLRQRPKR